MFDYWTKTSIINLKHFTVDIASIVLAGNRIFPLDHKNTVYTVSMNTNQWESIS